MGLPRNTAINNDHVTRRGLAGIWAGLPLVPSFHPARQDASRTELHRVFVHGGIRRYYATSMDGPLVFICAERGGAAHAGFACQHMPLHPGTVLANGGGAIP